MFVENDYLLVGFSQRVARSKTKQKYIIEYNLIELKQKENEITFST